MAGFTFERDGPGGDAGGILPYAMRTVSPAPALGRLPQNRSPDIRTLNPTFVSVGSGLKLSGFTTFNV
jgi:hypothetical protein